MYIFADVRECVFACVCVCVCVCVRVRVYIHIQGLPDNETYVCCYVGGGVHPESVFLCLDCRLGGFVPLSGFFHGFVGYFYQSSRTNVDSLWYKRMDIS